MENTDLSLPHPLLEQQAEKSPPPPPPQRLVWQVMMVVAMQFERSPEAQSSPPPPSPQRTLWQIIMVAAMAASAQFERTRTLAENNDLPLPHSTLELEAQSSPAPPPPPQRPMWQIIMVAVIAAGAQFGWAIHVFLLTPLLQFLLNPYVQSLRIPPAVFSFMWLCGPISGMIVQPVVGFYSDRCISRFGRRRPFIAGGAILAAISVFLIGYAVDIGVATGDKLGNTAKPRTIFFFVIGFWIHHVGYNMLQGPSRALIADLSGLDSSKIGTGNAFFSFFMAVGNVLGYAAGSSIGIHKMFPFTKTHSCDVYCANLKTCFLISIALLTAITILVLAIKEDVFKYEVNDGESVARRNRFVFLSKPMWILLLAMCLKWVAWFPWLLLDTHWAGIGIYSGKSYHPSGVNGGSFALMMNSVVAGVAALGIDQLGRICGGAKRWWGALNLILAVGLATTVLVTKMRNFNNGDHNDAVQPFAGVKLAGVKLTLIIFSLLGIPLSVTYSVPWALASVISNDSGRGQGLSLGLLSLTISTPMTFVSMVSGPWIGLLGGNLLAFVVTTIASAVSGILAFFLLPSPAQVSRGGNDT